MEVTHWIPFFTCYIKQVGVPLTPRSLFQAPEREWVPESCMTEASCPKTMVKCHYILGGWVSKGDSPSWCHRTEDSSVRFRSRSWAIQFKEAGILGEIIPGGVPWVKVLVKCPITSLIKCQTQSQAIKGKKSTVGMGSGWTSRLKSGDFTRLPMPDSAISRPWYDRSSPSLPNSLDRDHITVSPY